MCLELRPRWPGDYGTKVSDWRDCHRVFQNYQDYINSLASWHKMVPFLWPVQPGSRVPLDEQMVFKYLIDEEWAIKKWNKWYVSLI